MHEESERKFKYPGCRKSSTGNRAILGYLVHMYEKQSNPHDHAELLADITKSLAKNDPEFNKIFLEHAQKGVEGMMDALEQYSQKFHG